MVLSDSSDDDEAAILPPMSAKMLPLATPTGAKTRERQQPWEDTIIVPETALTTPTVAARDVDQVPEPAQVTLAVAAEANGWRNAKTSASSTTGQGGSRWACHFKTARRESEL